MSDTPSIAVGTQVRLTGVVFEQGNDVVGIEFPDGNKCFLDLSTRIAPDYVEVIHQPFKRGEVVYLIGQDIPCVVLVDESSGKVVLVEAREGAWAREMMAADYERRP